MKKRNMFPLVSEGMLTRVSIPASEAETQDK